MYRRSTPTILAILLVSWACSGPTEPTDEVPTEGSQQPLVEEEEEAPPPETAVEEADEDQVMQALADLQPAVTQCFTNDQEDEPELKGRIEILLTVSASETATDIQLDEVGGGVAECASLQLSELSLENTPEESVSVVVPYQFGAD